MNNELPVQPLGGLRAIMVAACIIALCGCGGDSATTSDGPSPDSTPSEDVGTVSDADVPHSDMQPEMTPDMEAMMCPECPGLQRCNPTTGACEETELCSEDVDCIGTRICDSGTCTEGCASTGCPGELVCSDTRGRCEEADACTSDEGCIENRICVAARCSDPCTEDALCPGRQNCDLESGRCLEPPECLSADDCYGQRLCVDATCVDPCSAERPCPEGLLCEDGECVEGESCTVDAQCRGDRLCIYGECLDRCREDADCPGARRCDVDSGRCPEPEQCALDDACDPGRVCVDDRCTDPCAPEDCPGAQRCLDNRCVEPVECVEDLDCIGRRYCDAGTCRPPCGDNSDCFGADTCDIDNGRCLSAYPGCRLDNDCMPGEACIRGVCRRVGCQEHADCEDRCVDQACGPRFGVDCAVDGECAAGLVCALPVGACVDVGCVTDEECDGLTPRCRNGRCSACREDGDCTPSEFCAQGQCVHHGACAADRDCPGPNTACVDGLCVPPPCGGDEFDDDLMIPVLATRTYSDLVLCDGDEDLYRIDLWPGQGLQVTLRHLPEDGALDVLVRSLDEETHARAENGVAVAGILAQNLVRRAEVLIRGRAGFRTRYSLDFVRTENDACVPDDGEALRGNDVQNRAQRWTGNRITNRLCEGDQDWYALRIPGGTTFDVELTSDQLNAVEMTLHNERGVEVSRAQSDGRALILSTEVAQAADYALRVALGVGGGSATNQISATVTPGLNAPQSACDAPPRLNVGQVYWTSPMLEAHRFSGSCMADARLSDRVMELRILEAGQYQIRSLREDRGGALFLRRECGVEETEIACSQGANPLVVDLMPGTYFVFVDMTLADGQGIEVQRID